MPHAAWRRVNRIKNTLLLGVVAVALAGGGILAVAEAHGAAALAWFAATGLVLVALLVQIAVELWHGAVGVDVLAALAMGGAIALGQPLAGAVIALMYAGGGALEEFAQGRSRRELSALLARSPKLAHRLSAAGLSDIPASAVAAGDQLLVKAGEVVPADGILAGPAVLDESALTGEALPIGRAEGDPVRSGVVNAGDPFEMTALAAAEQSTYAAIIRMVQGAEGSKAPFVRLADRFALGFVPLSLAVAGAAWAMSGDPLRALAVLVVATPCPLILAAPVAIVAGISRAAAHGILIKSGAALEALARAEVLLFDKTGTLTGGRARLTAVEAAPGIAPDELLRLAASLDQVSPHIMAATLVEAARRRGLPLSLPSEVREDPGAGLAGRVDGRRVALGGYEWIRSHVLVPPQGAALLRRMAREGAAGIFVAVDGAWAGALLLADPIRLETPTSLRRLRKAGIRRLIMVSGDRADVAESVAALLGIDAVLAERSPADKVAAVLGERHGAVTAMVGDGINDAPALAAADIGIALGARGAAASAEAADVVLMVDRLDRLAQAMDLARRTRRIALQSVAAGMALSGAAMMAAAAGLLAPVAGALLQEAIDVAAILNALRALAPARGWRQPRFLPAATARHLAAEHQGLTQVLERIEGTADRLDRLGPAEACRELGEVDRLLREQVIPHERQDDNTLYPHLAELLGGDDPLAAMSATHREILHLARLFGRMVADVAPETLVPDDLRDARRLLYRLGAILSLHFAQEEELFHSLAAGDDRG